MIHVCFGLHDKTGRYAKFTGTAMLSLFDNTTSEVTVHILHDNTLTQDNREKFIYLAGRYNQLVKFYNVEELCADKIAKFIEYIPHVKTSRLTIGALYRLLIPHLLSEDIRKVIYLDADIVVNLDIRKLWQIELGDKILAAVSEVSNDIDIERYAKLCYEGYVKREDYFNSGVLLMNVKNLRLEDEAITDGIKFVGNFFTSSCLDQEVLNYSFSTNYIKLPVRFNYFIKSHRNPKDIIIDNKIYHYTDSPSGKGFGLNMIDRFNRLWPSYFIKTPFFNEETIGRLYSSVQNLHVELKQSMINVSAMMSGKTRAFFTTPDNVAALREIFSVRKDESIILAESEQSFQKLIDAMKKAKGKKVFFIVLPNFPFNLLIQEGFVPGKDFVNGLEFLSEAQGLPLNSYPFVLAM